jgi:ubiquinone/menaquinone biosynthesis C-methylase UbiE
MPKAEVFDKYYKDYDNWFFKNELAYKAELKLIRKLIPKGKGLEVGVGTGKFAIPFGIKDGVDPSDKMAEIAEEKGIKVVKGVAEDLPYDDNSFDYVLLVTTICFVDDPLKTLEEARRVVKSDGHIIIGFVDRESTIGQEYEKYKDQSKFYSAAIFYSSKEIEDYLENSGFNEIESYQTLFHPLNEITAVEPVTKGYGRGAFIGMRGKKVARGFKQS